MENYKKGKNVEEPLDRQKIPISNLPNNFLWMQVHGGSKMRNLLTHALNEFPETRSVVWTGYGPAVTKTVSCVEIMKREHKYKLYQINKICLRTVEEFWDPLVPELEQLVVKRQLPMIHILLSMDPLDVNELGYQPPGTFVPYEQKLEKSNNGSSAKSKKHKTPTKEFSSLGVGNKKKSQNRPSSKQ